MFLAPTVNVLNPTMKAAVIFVACISCALALPAYIVPLNRERNVSWIRQVLDCPPLLYGGYDTTRCKVLEKRSQQSSPQRLTVLEIVEEEEPAGRVQVVQHPHAGTFAIKVPHKFNLGKPKCKDSEIYVSEVDICMPAEDHVIKTKLSESGKAKREQLNQDDKKAPAVVVHVGSFEKEKCAPDEIWVPEVAMCLEKNPPPPMEPEEDDDAYDY